MQSEHQINYSYAQAVRTPLLQNIITKQYTNIKCCTRTANKRYSAIKEYDKGSLGENVLNVKHINSFDY